MHKTKIEWCDSTWNPVTGCLHGCEYCYARGIANRFKGAYSSGDSKSVGKLHTLKRPLSRPTKKGGVEKACFPFNFEPTFHKYRLRQPSRWAEPQNIFVCSMTDLFGEWVPFGWIFNVIEACEAAPQHRYLFLTKSPHVMSRNSEILSRLNFNDNFWYGTSITGNTDLSRINDLPPIGNRFISVEPLHEQLTNLAADKVKWVIIGAETGKRKDKIIPKREWIESIVAQCKEVNVPVFMKDNLKSIWDDELMREFPW